MSPHVSHKMTPGFWGPFTTSFKLFFSKPLLFLPMALAYAAYMFLHLYAMSELAGGSGLFVVLEAIVAGVIGVLFYIFFVVVATSVVAGKKVDVAESIKYPFKRFLEIILLVLKSGWFVIKWPLPLLLLVIGAFAVTQFAGVELGSGLMQALGLVMAVGALVLVLWLMVRSLNVIFVYYVFVAEKANSKVSVEHSVDLMKGNWWRMLFFLIGFGLLSGILMAVVAGIFTVFIPIADVVTFIVLFLQAIIMSVMTLFLAQVFHMLKEYKRG